MKKENTLRSELALTQQDMALLLGVSRAHYAMYELGKRDLPLAAMQKIAAIISQTERPSTLSKNLLQKEKKQQQAQRLQQLQRLQRENEYQQLSVAKKIAAAAKKQPANGKRRLLADFLANTFGDNATENAKAKLVISKVSKIITAKEEEELLKLEIRKEVLEFEKSLLESKLLQANR